MNIQIFGRKKSFDTKKAERFFKERKIKYQLIDLDDKGVSRGELNSIKRCVSINDLIDTESKLFGPLNLNRIRDINQREEIILKHPKVIKAPIVRDGSKATVGYALEVWEEWIKDSRN